MFFLDHAPPHFHATYAGDEAVIDIVTLQVIKGTMPRRALTLVLEWAFEHRKELLEDWELCTQKKLPKKILPLK